MWYIHKGPKIRLLHHHFAIGLLGIAVACEAYCEAYIMDTPPHVIQYCAGEIVLYRDKQGIISSIVNQLDYDEFYLTDLDNGTTYRAAHFQLEKITSLDFDTDDSLEDVTVSEPEPSLVNRDCLPESTNDPQIPEASPRFTLLNDDELEDLASRRLSDNTK